MVTRTPPWENIKPMSLRRLPSRRRADSPTTPAAAPAAKAEHWDFTRADYAALVAAGGDLKVAADSDWFPKPLQENVLATLRSLLDPKRTPAAAWSVNQKDFYHGHVAVLRARESETLTRMNSEFLDQSRAQLEAALGKGVTSVTAENLPAARQVPTALQPAARTVLDEALKGDGVAIVYHTFEDRKSRPEGMRSGDPQRNWVTPLGSNQPQSLPLEHPKHSTMGDYVHVLSFAFLVDARGEVHICPGGSDALPAVTGVPPSK
jgi:hypothetical protein